MKEIKPTKRTQRPHACSQCDAAFGQAGNLSRHVRSVHNAVAEEKKKARDETKAKKEARAEEKKAKAIAVRIAAEAKKKAHAEEKAMPDAEKRKNPQGRREVNKVLHKRARAEAESFEQRMYENQEQMTEQERAILAIRPAFVAANRNNSSYYAARSDVSMVKNWVAAVPAFIPFFG